MTEVTRRRRVGSAPAVTWSVLAAFDRIADWAPNIDHSSALTSDAAGPGAARRVQVGNLTLVERVIEWLPEQRLSYSIEGLPPRLGTVRNTWTLHPDGVGTDVALTTTVQASARPPGPLIERLAARGLARASDQLLAGLAHQLSQTGYQS